MFVFVYLTPSTLIRMPCGCAQCATEMLMTPHIEPCTLESAVSEQGSVDISRTHGATEFLRNEKGEQMDFLYYTFKRISTLQNIYFSLSSGVYDNHL